MLARIDFDGGKSQRLAVGFIDNASAKSHS